MKKQPVFVRVMVIFMVTLWSCGLAYGGRIAAWGNNSDGQCNVPAGSDFVAVAAGEDYSVALKSDGSLVACGNNDDGQCDVPAGSDFTRIVATYRHTVALRSDGSLAAWGNNEWFQSDVPAGSNYIDIAAGAFHSIALKSNGSLVAWGANGMGQCNVPGGNDYVAVAAGWYHNIALKADGYIVAWGFNDLGQFNVPPGNDFIAVSAGWFHNIAIKADGSLVAWGHNSHGQSNVPTGDNFVQTDAGKFHSLTLEADGSLAAWGSNNQGQCNVPSGSDFVAVVAGRSHSLALVGVHFVDDDAPADPGPGNPDVSDPLEDGSQAHPFDAIQEGIDAAWHGDTVIVLDGTYTGQGNRDIDFLGKAITVKSENGPGNCSIDCQSSGRGFYFHNGETANSILDGLTIKNGLQTYGGGIYIGESNPIITNCIITENITQRDGGGVYIVDCSDNPMLINCVFSKNATTFFGAGGGIFSKRSSIIVKGCIFNENVISTNGGGICFRDSGGEINNCLFFENEASDGGGAILIWDSSATITNCTLVGNKAYGRGNSILFDGGGILNYRSSPVVINCILWDNWPQQIFDYYCSGPAPVTYSNIQGGWTGGGNIDADPLFVDPNGADGIIGTQDDNLRLLEDSPCIDAGDNSAVEPNSMDLDGNPRIINGTVDMGAYEFQDPRTFYVDTDAVGANDGSSWEDAFNTYFGLQAALAVASGGDEIRVAQGVYKPDITNGIVPPSRSATFQLKNGVTIKGGYAGYGAADPDERNIELFETILSGDLNGNDVDVSNPADLITEPTRAENSYHVVTGSGVDETAVLDGFTVTAGNANGSYSEENNCGGGIKGGSPALVNCTISWNSAGKSEFSSGDRGGGLKGCDGPIINCTISYNHARGRGGGLDACDGPITNCTIKGNSCEDWGGGLHWCNGAITNCTISSNSAGIEGGGLHTCQGTITNCIISGNSAGNGGGMYNWGYPTLTNCTFSGNSGGGLYSYYSIPTLTNCILWGNEGAAFSFGGDHPVVNYSCIEGWSPDSDGSGNHGDDPEFVDADGDDDVVGTEDDNLRLLPWSPCIDAGDNSAVTVETDLDGNPRIVNSIVDMGAYEHQLPRVIYVDTDAVGANDGSSWEDAFNTYFGLQTALAVASSGDQIRVAQGVYKPDITNGIVPPSRSATFQLKNGVTIKGGYAGFGAADPDARDVEVYETILSGDLFGNDNPDTPVEDLRNDPTRSDNCYHVFYHPTGTDLDETAILDGFTITAGNANGRYWPDNSGGGMYNSDSSPKVINCTFTDNFSMHVGGGIANASSSPTVSTCTFSGNMAYSWGGGIYNSSSSPEVTNCTFSGNRTDYGGGMINFDSNPTVSGCTFADNLVLRGGGMYNHYSSPTLNDCIFIGNSASFAGGGIHNLAGNPTLTNCVFTGNLAENKGGGMYNYGEEGACNPELINCTFISNHGGDSGGGMRNEYVSSLQLTGCMFSGNSAGDEGGGISNNETVSTISGCTFIGNSAPGGGGLNLDNEIGSTLTNCIFSGNRAEDGGGIRGEDENITMTNCTFSGNSADNAGGGICMDENIQLTNCIFWGNVAHGLMDESAQIRMRNSVSTIINYSCIQGWTGGWAGVGNIDVDPVFVDADGLDDIAGTEDDNLRLQPWSPCIDVGDNSVVDASTDLDGNPRIINGIVDMGAYEAPVSIEAVVHIVPRVISRSNRMKRIIAIMRLPDGISKRDVADEPFMLYPDDNTADSIEAIWQRVVGWGGKASVFALFDKAQLMNAVEHNGRVELTVVGKLTSGQYIYGSDTVRVVKPRRRRPRWRHRR